MVTQLEAVTGGRRKKRSIIDEITARAAFLPQRRAAEEAAKFNEAQLAELKRANLARETLSEEQLGLSREQTKSAREEAARADLISGAGLTAQAAFLANKAGLLEPIKGFFAKGAGETAGAQLASSGFGALGPTGAAVPTVAEVAPVVAEGAVAPGTTALSTAGPLAAAVALQAGRKNIGEFTEEQIGTSVKPVADIGGRVAQGALIGSVVPGVGTAIGAGVGLVTGVAEETFGWLDDQLGTTAATILNPVGAILSWTEDQGICIIVTACTDPDSYEVEVTRAYRDNFMDKESLRGYYMIAEKVVPWMNKSERFKRFIKKHLVDRMIEVGEYWLDLTWNEPRMISLMVTQGFLRLCKSVGKQRLAFTRSNGEVF